ncbi:carboxymuconolactone decarboxylase family protein [Croceicoccus ponticola]|uniref:Carboxymuconolactone decarboxylase family protein n=1 Tax=Croceicoccus ponticola TaxID=2217664 RepID=A0A437GWE1_9SPHN|nr:carboxymuconolactone decarboxylase family protein [Croceicoccus ponticola]RVQ66051.1 carboxymuconolactone decarboxylase family protein [Croceicoccus ponticola]
MVPRIDNPFAKAAAAIKGMYAVEGAIAASLDKTVLQLVKLRASQMNGCAYCLHMHAIEARANGESEMRIYLLDAWRESSLYSARERAALAWTEALTNVSRTGAPDDDYALVEAAFDEVERVHLTLAIGSINLWNRLQVGLRAIHPTGKSHAPTA